MNNTESQETAKHTPQFKAKLYCGSTFGESTEATLNLEGSGIHHSDLAAFVTKAVNCHDDLLEACKQAYYSMSKDGGKYIVMAPEKLIAMLESALEKAGAQ